MPYRRLPNTDKARIRAMQIALNGYNNAKNGKDVLFLDTVRKLNSILVEFTNKVDAYNSAFAFQIKNQKKHKIFFYNCKLYVSHFIQVMNFAILRGELDKSIKKYYQLKVNSSNLPALNSEKQLILWGQRIIKGELIRINNGEKPIENPSLHNLNLSYEKFTNSINYQKELQNLTRAAQNSLVNIRPDIDLLIKNLWDEIETFFEKYPPLIRREKAKLFGINYIYRKNEERIELEDLLKL